MENAVATFQRMAQLRRKCGMQIRVREFSLPFRRTLQAPPVRWCVSRTITGYRLLWQIAQHVLQAVEAAEVTIGGGGFGELQDLSGFRIGELLEVSQGEDFAVGGGHGIECGVDASFDFLARGGLAGSCQLAGQLSSQDVRRGIGERGEEFDFASHVASLHTQMLAMHECELLQRQKTKPHEKRDARIGKVFGESSGDVGIRLLQHISGIDAASQTTIQTEPDHAQQSRFVTLQLRRKSLRIGQRCVGVIGVVGHEIHQEAGVRRFKISATHSDSAGDSGGCTGAA